MQDLLNICKTHFKDCKVVMSVGAMRGKYLLDLPCKKIALDAYKHYLNEIAEECEKRWGYAEEILPTIASNSIDGIMALDFIEHVEKNVGWTILQDIERIASKAILVYTPKGFKPQHEKKTKNMTGLELDLQTHRSGWTQKDLESVGYYVKPFQGGLLGYRSK